MKNVRSVVIEYKGVDLWSKVGGTIGGKRREVWGLGVR